MVMSIIQVFDEDSQRVNDISNLSVNKLPNNIPKINEEQITNFEEVLIKLTKRTPYPNFRFFCPYCASLDVFITIDKISNELSVDCLDCKKIWIEEKFVQTEVSNQCLC